MVGELTEQPHLKFATLIDATAEPRNLLSQVHLSDRSLNSTGSEFRDGLAPVKVGLRSNFCAGWA
jgi:hypothetical protein